MPKALKWKPGTSLSLRLREHLYCLAQMHVSPYMQFYDAFSNDDRWEGVDLNTVSPLFCVTVAERRLLPLVERVVGGEEVTPDQRDIPRLMIDPALNFDDGYPFSGGSLVEVDARGETVGTPVVKANLEVGVDDEIIRRYELTNMWVTPDEVSDRLIRYFDTGVNWDVHKEKVFPGIESA